MFFLRFRVCLLDGFAYHNRSHLLWAPYLLILHKGLFLPGEVLQEKSKKLLWVTISSSLSWLLQQGCVCGAWLQVYLNSVPKSNCRMVYFSPSLRRQHSYIRNCVIPPNLAASQVSICSDNIRVTRDPRWELFLFPCHKKEIAPNQSCPFAATFETPDLPPPHFQKNLLSSRSKSHFKVIPSPEWWTDPPRFAPFSPLSS